MTLPHPAILLYWAVAVGLVVAGGLLVGNAGTVAMVGAGVGKVGAFGIGFALGADAKGREEVVCHDI